MSPAPRKPGNRGLPPNLHTHPKGYRYRRPDGSYCYLGIDRQRAIEAALAANSWYAPKGDLFSKIVDENDTTLSKAIDEYLASRLPVLEIADETRKNREYVLRKIQGSDLGSRLVDEITTRDLYLYLNSQATDWVRQSRRAMLLQLFSWAIQTGLRQDNPASALERPKAKSSRQRLSLAEFNTLRAHAPAWLQNAMDLGLHTLQRPGDVLLFRWDDLTATGLRVVQRKTGKRLEIEIGPALREVLNRCRDAVVSPFIVHRLPEKMRPRGMRAKARVHHTQVLLEQAEREFDEVRIASGLYKNVSHPPTLHEIRSLGASLYREARWPEEKVQIQLGHSEVQMTRHYLEGHEAPWEKIDAGLNLK